MNSSFHLGDRGKRLLLQGAVAVAAMVGVVTMQRSQLQQPSLWESNPQLAEQQEAAHLRLLSQLPTFGFDNVIADWAFLKFLEYYGDIPVRDKTGYGLAPLYFDVITRRDPRFVDTYPFLSSSISYQLGQPEAAVKLMERGTAALSPEITPNAYRVWRFKGLDQLLLLGDVPGAIRSHEMAAEWAKPVDPQLADLLSGTAEFLKRDPNSLPVRVNSWASIYVEALVSGDRQTQAKVKTELAKLGYEVQINEAGQPQLRKLTK